MIANLRTGTKYKVTYAARRFAYRASVAFLLCALCTVHAWGQNVSSALQGTVVDTLNALVVGADVQLVNQGTGVERTGVTGAKGLFRFSQLLPGTYKISVKMRGFKSYTQKEIVLVGSETRDIGNVQLEIGSTTESVVVNADVTPVQLASSEKASTIDQNEMQNQAVRGRDMVAFMDLIPGLVDNPQSGAGASTGRNVTSTQALSGITINGADLGRINYTVDGIPAIDSSTQYLHYEPNVDSIQEIKVMTSNYQAEFGRNSGGTITVITKGGGKDFHGTGWWSHKHEQFNANYKFNDNNDPRLHTPLNRSNVAGWSLGGPIYIPGKFNTQKNKLFFFATEEYTRQLVPASNGTVYSTMPTAAQLTGDFSAVIDPTTNLPEVIKHNGTTIPGCESTRIVADSTCNISGYEDARGQALLNWIYSSSGGSAAQGVYNYNGTPANWTTAGASGAHPRHNDMIRIDANPTSKLSAYFRWIRDLDSQVKHEMQSSWDVWPVSSPNPGHGYVGNATWIINPSTVNELTVGKDWTAWGWNAMDPASAAAEIANLPLSYDIAFNTDVNGLQSVLPNLYFNASAGAGPGGPPGGGGGCTSTPCNAPNFGPFLWDYYNTQNYWTVTDNLSKVIMAHNLKVGLYVEKQNKIQPGVQNYNGIYNFGPESQARSMYDAGDGYANAYMGTFKSFSQTSGRTVADVNFWNIEWYAQDNWRVNKRLTLDVGVRFYHQTPYVDNAGTVAYFNPDTWVSANQPAINQAPGPLNGTISCAGQGADCSLTNGMVVAGANGAPKNTYYVKWLTVAPRLGFALDVFGNGKTAIRGGFGMFPNRESGQLFNGGAGNSMSGQAPIINKASLGWNSFANIGDIPPNSPVALNNWQGKSPISKSLNASFGVQQNVGHNTVLDVSYVGTWAQDQPLTVNINPVPLWSCPNCGAAQQDALRSYIGYQDINMTEFVGYNNYHSLQSTLQRRFSNGLMLGAAYTLSKQLSLGAVDPLLSHAVNIERNYGGGPASQNLVINYSYTLPSLAKKLNSQPGKTLVGVVTDNWTLSGMAHFATGGAYTVSCSAPGYDGTGTPSEGAGGGPPGGATVAAGFRCDQISDPKVGRKKLAFNPDAYTIAAAHTLGNAPQNNLVGPGIQNFDITIRKAFPLGGEGTRRKLQIEAQAFNVLNHPQYKGVNSSLNFQSSFNPPPGPGGPPPNNYTIPQTWSLAQSTRDQIGTTGLPNTGVGTYSASTQEPRIIGFNARIEF